MLQLREYQDNLCWVEKHRQKNNIYSMILFTCNSKNRQTPVIKVKSVVTWGWESGWVLNGAGGKFWCDCIHWLFYILIVSVFHNCIKLWKFIKLNTFKKKTKSLIFLLCCIKNPVLQHSIAAIPVESGKGWDNVWVCPFALLKPPSLHRFP